jgi:hypothetical protein
VFCLWFVVLITFNRRAVMRFFLMKLLLIILPPVRNHNPIEDALPLRDQETLRTCACKPCRPGTFSTRTGRLEFILPGSNLYGYIGGWPSPSKKRIRETKERNNWKLVLTMVILRQQQHPYHVVIRITATVLLLQVLRIIVSQQVDWDHGCVLPVLQQ